MSYPLAGPGGWQTWTTFPGDGEFSRRQQADHAPAAEARPRSYRGALRSVEKHTVNVLSMDDYLRGVVPLEIPASWPPGGPRPGGRGAHVRRVRAADRDVVLPDLRHPSCQVYGGFAAEHPAPTPRSARPQAGSCSPGRAGLHPVLLQQRRLDLGRLVPYLAAQPDPYDDWSGNPHDPGPHGHAPGSSRPGQRSAPSTDRVSRDGNGDWGGRVTLGHAGRPPGWRSATRSRHRRRLPVSGSGSGRPGSSWRRRAEPARRAPAPGRRPRPPGCRRARAARRCRRPAR